MGESVAEATVIKWTKNPGDHVEADDTVMEIATDKVDSDVPSPVTGKLLEQLCKENDVVQVGAVIAIIETAEPEAASPTQAPAYQPPPEQPTVQETPPPAPVYQAPAQTPPVAQAPEAPQVSEFQQPAASTPPQPPVYESPIPELEIPEISKQPVFSEQREENAQPVPYTEQLEQKAAAPGEGAPNGGSRFYSPLVKNIAAQENISNAELDRIPGTGAEGRLTKDDLLNYIQNRYQPAAQTPEVSAERETENTFHEEAGVEPQEASTEETESAAEEREPEQVTEQPSAHTGEREPEPVVETPETVSAAPEPVAETIVQEPIAEKPQPAPVFETPKSEPASQPYVDSGAKTSGSMSGGDEIIEMDRMRRLIADHMVMSKQTSPHVTSFVEADVTNLVLWREKVKNGFEKREGEKITFTPLFIEAVVRSIKDMPMINIQVTGTQIIKKKDINISMATALPSGNLIVPVIKKADELSIIGLTKAVNDLANRARTGKLKPDDVQGGTFTITNVGSFGNVMGTPIINQPQVAILAVGAIRKKPAVIETLQGDMIGIRHMMFLSLSYDHRVVDGALGGSFVRRVADYLENWDPGREI